MQCVSIRRGGLGAAYLSGEAIWKSIAATDYGETNVIANQFRSLISQVAPQKGHQPRDFRFWPAPIVTREGVKGQRSNAVLRRRFHDAPDGSNAGFMPVYAWQTPSGRPPSVAIHDNADM
jgi:hypothetical protein